MNGLSTALLAFFTLLSLPDFYSSPSHTYSSTINVEQVVHGVTTELNGPTTVEYWDMPFIKVETQVWENTGSAYSLEYSKKKGDFRLETRYEMAGTQLVIASRKINTQIFVNGKKAEVRKKFKVLLPRYLNYEVVASTSVASY